MTLQRTPELYKFSKHFFDYDERTLPWGSKAHYELFMRNGLKVLDAEAKRRLALFLDLCLDGTHSDKELCRLWDSTSPQMSIEPIIPFLRDVRTRLGGSYAFALFGPPEE